VKWPLLAWGGALGPVWVATTMASYALLGRYATGEAPPPSRYERHYPLWAAVGLPFGLLSAALGTVWPDAVFTAYVVVSFLVPLAALPTLRRTFARGGDACENDGACETCPIACSRHQPELSA
jgi:hypothetical protein